MLWQREMSRHLDVQDLDFKTSYRTSLVAQTVEDLPAVWDTQVQSLDEEDPLEKEMANHSSILSWRIPRIEEPGGLQPVGSQRSRHDSNSHFPSFVSLRK